MERLTKQWGNNDAVPTQINLDFVFDLDDATSQVLTEIFNRLASYEDTRLEPEEVVAKLKWADHAAEVLNDIFGKIGIFDVSHLRELVQAEQDGRLVVLPCKVGATVYLTDTIDRGSYCTRNSRMVFSPGQ